MLKNADTKWAYRDSLIEILEGWEDRVVGRRVKPPSDGRKRSNVRFAEQRRTVGTALRDKTVKSH